MSSSSIEWMAWIQGTAIFVACVLVFLAVLVGIAVRWPSTTRKGFLPIETTRGDRIYISFLGLGLVMITYMTVSDWPLPYGVALAVIAWMGPVLRWG